MQPTATPNEAFAIQPSFSFAVQVVPEPETYAMFLAGLGLIGWRMRRSKKYQTTPI
ncbi:PEP-CTERM sorting domain-containing protein [Nitrosospira sp. Nsp2]|uniref:PEP-CTERM sorting domain-containing protein n=1 Tax=Nitrosospira sp. Nsp2 TaxID=136548 RepID=UPI000D31304E|nr:PEP-CTERM sorting domain-containing protein [Nitrosospira sp. Nsp2]